MGFCFREVRSPRRYNVQEFSTLPDCCQIEISKFYISSSDEPHMHPALDYKVVVFLFHISIVVVVLAEPLLAALLASQTLDQQVSLSLSLSLFIILFIYLACNSPSCCHKHSAEPSACFLTYITLSCPFPSLPPFIPFLVMLLFLICGPS